ncbi:MAG: ABC transporter permease [Lachnospiraceae bacterium]|nr:ABC transporter permease [Lachnospiraceae bacterium]
MIRYLIKNNLKIMYRSPVNILLYVLCPIVISAVLISAFSAMMESYEGSGQFTVGYRVAEESVFDGYMDKVAAAGRDSGITFAEYKDGDPEKLIKDYKLGGFVEFGSDSYTIYETEDTKAQSGTLQYMLSAIVNSAISGDYTQVRFTTEKPFFVPAIDSTDYYGIIYVVYFGWCALVCAAGLFSSEKKHRIDERLRVSNLSVLQLFLARYIPLVATVAGGIGIASLVGGVIMGVHWGKIALSAVIVLLSVMAATAMEMFIYELTNSMLASIIISFGIVWVLGYIGGSFETYMFSSHPDWLKQLDPIYHENRALVELSGMGHSDYVKSAILILAGFIAVFTLLNLAVGSIRRSVKQ